MKAAEGAARKRTRRGNRGGRNRKRKPATETAAEPGEAVEELEVVTAVAAEAVVAEAPVAETPADEAEEPSENGSDAWEYTPMSEWGGLDDREG